MRRNGVPQRCSMQCYRFPFEGAFSNHYPRKSTSGLIEAYRFLVRHRRFAEKVDVEQHLVITISKRRSLPFDDRLDLWIGGKCDEENHKTPSNETRLSTGTGQSWRINLTASSEVCAFAGDGSASSPGLLYLWIQSAFLLQGFDVVPRSPQTRPSAPTPTGREKLGS